MKLVYVPEVAESYKKSIFLCGPTPRTQEVKSWRPEFIDCLSELNFDGTVFIPENRDSVFKQEYLDQVEWEHKNIKNSTLTIFWVPRSDDLPGFTTNVEFGYWITQKKVYYGRPDGANSIRYLDWLYKKEKGTEPFKTMKELAYFSASYLNSKANW